MITLRDYKNSDVNRLLKLANNENVARYLTGAFPSPYTLEDAEWWVSTGSKNGIVKVIELNGEFVGSVGLTCGTNERRFSGEVGYWLGEAYWGQGIASVALSQLTEVIFEETDIVRLFAPVYSPNKPSMRVLEKAGYRHEATLANSIYKNGEFYNEHIYSLLKKGLF